jgi:leukotriene-A4 hydrolase
LKSNCITFFFSLSLLILSCSDETIDKKNIASLIVNTGEDASYANYNAVFLPKLHLDLDINFENKTIYGVAKYEIGKRTCDTLVLDIAHLQIQKVSIITNKNKELNTDYLIGVEDSTKGAPLSISIPRNAKKIVIYYQTNENNPAFHWYTQPSKQPYLYTIPKERLTRHIFPCQDLKNLSLKIDADVKSSNQLLPLLNLPDPPKKIDSTSYSYKTNYTIPLQSFGLIAGKFKKAKLSNNTTVYYEFSNKQFIKELKHFSFWRKNIESIYGKFPYKNLQLIILPTSFTYNRLDFKYLLSLHASGFSKANQSTNFIIEELINGWPNPLFTPSCQNELKFREGIEKYLKNKLIEQNINKESADIQEKIIVNQYYYPKVVKQNPSFLPNSIPFCNEQGNSPFSINHYQIKGYFFAKQLEKVIGFEQTLEFFKDFLSKREPQTLISFSDAVEVRNKELKTEIVSTIGWYNTENLPRLKFINTNLKLKRIIQLKRLLDQRKINTGKIKKNTIGFTSADWFLFISLLPSNYPIEKVDFIKINFPFALQTNKETQLIWWKYLLKRNQNENPIELNEYLTSTGNINQLYPIYKLLFNNNKLTAYQLFNTNSAFYPKETIEILSTIFKNYPLKKNIQKTPPKVMPQLQDSTKQTASR